MKITSKGSFIYWSERIGMNNSCFRMAKLRTMKISAPIVPSNLINSQEKYFIRFGKLLRNSGIDELPQFYNILKGDMSFVGPRPVIINEYDIITKRNEKGINKLKPGLTGLAQIKGRDKLSVKEKIKYDEIYMQKTNLVLDLKIILLTNYWLFCENILKNFNKLSDVLIINEHD